jgi:hypothetical protein
VLYIKKALITGISGQDGSYLTVPMTGIPAKNAQLIEGRIKGLSPKRLHNE